MMLLLLLVYRVFDGNAIAYAGLRHNNVTIFTNVGCYFEGDLVVKSG